MSTSTPPVRGVPELRVVGAWCGRGNGAPATPLAEISTLAEAPIPPVVPISPAVPALTAVPASGRPAAALTVPATVRAALAAPRIVPVPESLAGLFPWRGMRVGSVVSVQGSASLLFALLSTASAAGAWAAVVGRDDLGLLAAAEAGVQVRRLVLVPRPGAELVAVVSALLDGMELVALAGVERLTPAEARRLTGRARQRGAVLLPLGDWPGADVRLHCERIEWDGLGDGYGRLRSMRMTVRAVGRGASARPRTAVVELPGGRCAESPGHSAGSSGHCAESSGNSAESPRHCAGSASGALERRRIEAVG